MDSDLEKAIRYEIEKYGSALLSSDKGIWGSAADNIGATTMAQAATFVANHHEHSIAIESGGRCHVCNDRLECTWINNWKRQCKSHYPNEIMSAADKAVLDYIKAGCMATLGRDHNRFAINADNTAIAKWSDSRDRFEMVAMKTEGRWRPMAQFVPQVIATVEAFKPEKFDQNWREIR